MSTVATLQQVHQLLASSDDGTGFGTFAGTFLILGLIAATVVIFKMMSGSLKRMANVQQHPEDFGVDDAETDASAEGEATSAAKDTTQE